MKNFITLVFASFLAIQVMAQDISSSSKSTSNSTFSLGIETGLPTGDFSNTHSFAIGASAKVAAELSANAAFTISVGYMSFSGKTVTVLGSSFKNDAFNVIPVKAGIRGIFDGGFYVEPQIGYTFFTGNNSSGAFTYAPSIGFITDSKIDFSLRYEVMTRNNSNLSLFGVRLGFGL
ncbi:MAG: hypothetical protein KGZ59_02935 [Chitinophagaceae bacterium]|nr:hypothetical protein [Chitinophagaceae bacterium]